MSRAVIPVTESSGRDDEPQHAEERDRHAAKRSEAAQIRLGAADRPADVAEARVARVGQQAVVGVGSRDGGAEADQRADEGDRARRVYSWKDDFATFTRGSRKRRGSEAPPPLNP